jgi:hypothetical protein
LTAFKSTFLASAQLYHVTYTDKVPVIQKEGLRPMQMSNWVKGKDGDRYGGGLIFACTKFEDAIRWGAKMDWEFHQGMGTGKISIIRFNKVGKWVVDSADPISQAANIGQWVKHIGAIPPEDITGIKAITPDMVMAITRGNPLEKF